MGKIELGKRIRVMRSSRGLTQAQLAEQIGVSSSTIAMYEIGKRVPDMDTVEALADIFNVPRGYLMYGEDGIADDRDRDRLEALHQNPQLGLLFDRARTMKKEDVDFLVQMAEKILGERR